MSDQRPVFRFRLPWLTTPSTPAQASSPPRAPASRPAADIQIPAQPTAAAPVVRPPFRPAGVAPPPPLPLPPFRVQTPPRTGPQPSAASQTGARTRDTTQLSLPAQAIAQVQVPSPAPPPPPPSQIEAQLRTTEPRTSLPSQFGPQTGVASQPASTARAAIQAQSASSQPPAPGAVQASPSTEFRPSSPSRAGFQLASPVQAASQPPPPPPPPPPQVQGSPRIVESQPSSSSNLVGAQNGRISSPQASPARPGTQSRAASQPQPTPPPPRSQSNPNSPSRFGAQTRVPSQPLSPAKASVEAAQARAASRVTTPPQAASQARVVPRSQAPSKPSSPARPTPRAASPSRSIAQPQAVSPPSPPSRITPLNSELVAELPSPPRTVQPTTQPSLSPPLVSRKESSNPVVVQPQAPVKDIDTNHVEQKKNPVIELLTEASSRLKAQTKELSAFAFQENHVENQETLETKETVPTSSFSEKYVRPVFSRPKDRNPVIESRQKPSVQKDIRDDISKFVNKVSNGNTKDNDDKRPMSVITIAGDNRGATMTLGSSTRERAVHIRRGYKLNPDESNESTTDGEGTSKGKNVSKHEEEETKRSYINNNSQGINNSIVFNSSITEHNPGVHMVISRSRKEPNTSNGRIESLSRAEMNFTRSQKLTYDPTIRRRCLRGLMMEPSDSDNDDPDKPRRHGCPYAREEMNKDDNNIDVL